MFLYIVANTGIYSTGSIPYSLTLSREKPQNKSIKADILICFNKENN